MNNPNSEAAWDSLWKAEGDDTWRTYPILFSRITALIPPGTSVLDVGCGVGVLLDKLKAERNCNTFGCDISPSAVLAAAKKGHQTFQLDLNQGPPYIDHDVVVATELLEHLDDDTLHDFLVACMDSGKRCLFAVPNNCLGPDEEPQHVRKWTAKSFKDHLWKYFPGRVRVECIDDGCPRLLAVCNDRVRPYRLAFTMPVKNEADDIERVLKSFRGAADLMVIGVDSTTTDATREIAALYADEVFDFVWTNDFSAARNACIERCKRWGMIDKDAWIFMSEGHEHLEAGLDELLFLDQLPGSVQVVEVRREDRNHAWMFPWLFKARDDIFFKNPVHNTLVYDETKVQVGQIPAIRTWHNRSHANAVARTVQRKGMNRQALIDKLKADPTDTRSCYYLANEWRGATDVAPDVARDRAITYYQRYLALPGKNGPERYQARLALSQCLAAKLENEKDPAERQRLGDAIYDTLIVAQQDDWSRTEHWLYLGDLCYTHNKTDMAVRFYELCATGIGREPLSFMWIEKANYTWVPAQKLVTIYAELGLLAEALAWCDKLLLLLPEWAPEEARKEVYNYKTIIQKKLEN